MRAQKDTILVVRLVSRAEMRHESPTTGLVLSAEKMRWVYFLPQGTYTDNMQNVATATKFIAPRLWILRVKIFIRISIAKVLCISVDSHHSVLLFCRSVFLFVKHVRRTREGWYTLGWIKRQSLVRTFQNSVRCPQIANDVTSSRTPVQNIVHRTSQHCTLHIPKEVSWQSPRFWFVFFPWFFSAT